MKVEKLGWLVAGLAVLAICALGFRAPGDKVGVVDLNKVVADSDFAKAQNESFRTTAESRNSVLEFLATYRTVSPDLSKKFHDLSIKEPMAAADKLALEKVKQDAIAQDKAFRDLQTKAGPTDDDRTKLADFGRNGQANEALSEKWRQEFEAEAQSLREKFRIEALDRVRAAVAKVSKDQGFSTVFSQDVVPYSANDITPDAVKAMNVKK